MKYFSFYFGQWYYNGICVRGNFEEKGMLYILIIFDGGLYQEM